ncbi:MAG: hypothetical protein ABIA93_05465 [Candidatus Woesearchaeota archaeon]
MRIYLLLIVIVILASGVAAAPVLPTEFYGTVHANNDAGAIGAVIRAYDSDNVLCGMFTIVNVGYYGLLSCTGDDITTATDEGAREGNVIRFTYNGNPASAWGQTTWSSGTFHIVDITYPELVCGDNFCDDQFETCKLCEADCGTCPPAGTGGTGGTGGGGGGGGGGAAGGASSQGICVESWKCESWSSCLPDGLQSRVCEDLNQCGTSKDLPSTERTCNYIPGCFDSIQNGAEEDIDCGGPCKPCEGCNDGIQNQGEQGIDCGGPCNPCPSCFDKVRNQGEEGVDCGGPCTACDASMFAFPARICERTINPLNLYFLIFIFIILIGTTAKVTHSYRKTERIRHDLKRPDLERARAYLSERRKMWLFVVSVTTITAILIAYYYFFGICTDYYKYLWLLAVFLLASPLIIHYIMRWFEYNEKERIEAEKRLHATHKDQVDALIRLQNDNIIGLERELGDAIKKLLERKDLEELRSRSKDLERILKRMLELYTAYKDNPHPYRIERSLCEDIYSLEHADDFVALAEKIPAVKDVYERLKFLYKQYEEKERLYEQSS